jgi:hypothetical protein
VVTRADLAYILVTRPLHAALGACGLYGGVLPGSVPRLERCWLAQYVVKFTGVGGNASFSDALLVARSCRILRTLQQCCMLPTPARARTHPPVVGSLLGVGVDPAAFGLTVVRCPHAEFIHADA